MHPPLDTASKGSSTVLGTRLQHSSLLREALVGLDSLSGLV